MKNQYDCLTTWQTHLTDCLEKQATHRINKSPYFGLHYEWILDQVSSPFCGDIYIETDHPIDIMMVAFMVKHHSYLDRLIYIKAPTVEIKKMGELMGVTHLIWELKDDVDPINNQVLWHLCLVYKIRPFHTLDPMGVIMNIKGDLVRSSLYLSIPKPIRLFIESPPKGVFSELNTIEKWEIMQLADGKALSKDGPIVLMMVASHQSDTFIFMYQWLKETHQEHTVIGVYIDFSLDLNIIRFSESDQHVYAWQMGVDIVKQWHQLVGQYNIQEIQYMVGDVMDIDQVFVFGMIDMLLNHLKKTTLVVKCRQNQKWLEKLNEKGFTSINSQMKINQIRENNLLIFEGVNT